jgi:hypothetical protein
MLHFAQYFRQNRESGTGSSVAFLQNRGKLLEEITTKLPTLEADKNVSEFV